MARFHEPIEIDGKKVVFGEMNFMNLRHDDCLWSGCPVGKPVQEARYGRASIRCCGHEDCIRWAAEFAVEADAAFGPPIAQA